MGRKTSTDQDSTAMPIMAHLEELRQRLIRAVLALVVMTAISFGFTKKILNLLIRPMGEARPALLGPTESIGNFMKVALISGVTLAMPVIVYQFFRFIAPGLTKQEKRYLLVIVPGATISFLLGAAFTYFVMLPAAITFLYDFLQDVADPFWSLDKYLTLVTRMLFWVGMSFETPLVFFFLAKLGIVSPAQLARSRKYAIIVIAIIAAVVTPTYDLVNMSILMLPLLVLYEIAILLTRLA